MSQPTTSPELDITNEDAGIAAIILLQEWNDTHETKAQATAGWRAMSDNQKRITLEVAFTVRETLKDQER